jgi:hypothetical protein
MFITTYLDGVHYHLMLLKVCKRGFSSVESESISPLISVANRAATRFSFSNRKLGAIVGFRL